MDEILVEKIVFFVAECEKYLKYSIVSISLRFIRFIILSKENLLVFQSFSLIFMAFRREEKSRLFDCKRQRVVIENTTR